VLAVHALSGLMAKVIPNLNNPLIKQGDSSVNTNSYNIRSVAQLNPSLSE
jgi:hypothetical protein